MPITKERLISILLAAQNLEGEIQRLCLTINDRAASAINGISDPLKTLEHIASITSNADLYIPRQDFETLANERAHWKANFRRAERDRRYQEGRRRDLGTPQTPQPLGLEDAIRHNTRQFVQNIKASEDKTFLPYDPVRAAKSNEAHAAMLQGMRDAIEVECEGFLSQTHYATAHYDNALGTYFYGCICDPALRALELVEIKEHLQTERDQTQAEDAFDPHSLAIQQDDP